MSLLTLRHFYRQAILNNTDLTGTDMTKARLSKADLTGTKGV